MSSLLKAGLVSLLVASGGLGPSGSMLCSADFSEFDELEEKASVASVAPAVSEGEQQEEEAAAPDGGAAAAATVAAAASDGADEGAAATGGVDDEFSSSSQPVRSRRGGGKKKKRAAAPPKKKAQPASSSATAGDDATGAGVGGAGAAAGAKGRPSAGPQEPSSYFYEYIALAGVAAYVTNFFLGKRTNEQKATAWANRFAKVLRRHFHQVGPLSGEDLEIVADEGNHCGMLLTKYSQSEFKLFATGNDYLRGLYVDLIMQQRQDFISTVWNNVAGSSEDILRLDVAFENEMAEQFVLAVLPEKRKLAAISAHKDLDLYAKEVHKSRPRALPESLVVLADCSEPVKSILTNAVCKALAKGERCFRRLHISDRMPEGANSELSQRRLVLELALPASQRKWEEAGVDDLVEAFFLLAGAVTFTRVSPATRERLADLRRRVVESKMKQDHASREEQQMKRADEKAAREREMYNAMTPSQKKKWAEKEEKKRLKKEQKRALRQSQMKMKMR